MTTTEAVALTEKQTAYIAGLRDIADWLEDHPEYEPIATLDACIWFHEWDCEPKAELAKLTRQLRGFVTKGGTDSFFEVYKKFGPHKISGNAYREEVCEKVVTRIEEEITEPDPVALAAVPEITHTVEREVITWSCPPSLMGGAK